ncbi:MAG TPA: N-acetylmuramoyl-L-alanine amidase [Thermoanaerobaculia bacterium]|jgi:N-acetylmuramoyl-L-alanine amidase|nr:N-acetylmuramoyl-L-alanine amidase [Thermoanaerobaculia bacterium]
MRAATVRGLAALALLGSLASSAAALTAPRSVRVPLEDGVVATLSEERGILVEAVPRRGEGLSAFARRLCGDGRLAPQVAEANGGAQNLVAGIRYAVPFGLLSQEWQLKATKALFTEDRGQADGWRHQVRGVGPLQRESLWRLAEWFTGTGENFRAIREYNELLDDDLTRGAVVTIPSELLLPVFRTALPVPEKPFLLEFGADKDGEFAIYRLRPGEALYSSVVVRFTGRLFAADVNALATQIARRSGIRDVTDIPIGYRVKIPFDLLQPEFLPEGHPKRKEYEESLRASARFSNQVKARGLAGITVILDAGHGGQDVGASLSGVWESLYVYDIAMRIKRVLELQTASRPLVTTRDGGEFRVQEMDVLPFSRGHSVLTTPPYPIADPKVGVNLRWYLANSLYRKTMQTDKDPQKVVFLSIHADSLHPSLRGVMAYIPAADMRDGSFGKNGTVYTSRKEVQENPRVVFPREDRERSEGLSRELAKQVVAAFEAGGLPVHPFKPVRDKIIRNNGEWVPAVLRYNSIPAKILLEVCNLANDQDRKLIQTRAYRQKVAEAVVRGLLAYYGEDDGSPSQQVAASAK